jgi:hypothetical protein
MFRLLLWFAATLGVVVGQPGRPDLASVTKELNSLCAQENATDAAEEEILRDHKSVAVTQALLPGADLWAFVTDPATPYRDRMLAARLGGGALRPKQLPELWRAQADINRPAVPRLTSPCDYITSASLRPDFWPGRRRAFGVLPFKPRSVLFSGKRFDEPFEYPVAQEERDRAPWVWQMERMLPVLAKSVGAYYAQPEHYAAMAEVAWKFQAADWYEARMREDALCRGPRNGVLVENIVRLVLEEVHPAPRVSEDAYGVVPIRSLDYDGYGGDHFNELVRAAQIVILRRTKRRVVAGEMAFVIGVRAKHLRSWRSATAMLLVAEWALNPEVDAGARYFYFGDALCNMVDDPPYVPDSLASGSKIAECLAALDAWFAKRRPELEKAEAAERDHLDALAAELHDSIDGREPRRF